MSGRGRESDKPRAPRSNHCVLRELSLRILALEADMAARRQHPPPNYVCHNGTRTSARDALVCDAAATVDAVRNDDNTGSPATLHERLPRLSMLQTLLSPITSRFPLTPRPDVSPTVVHDDSAAAEDFARDVLVEVMRNAVERLKVAEGLNARTQVRHRR